MYNVETDIKKCHNKNSNPFPVCPLLRAIAVPLSPLTIVKPADCVQVVKVALFVPYMYEAGLMTAYHITHLGKPGSCSVLGLIQLNSVALILHYLGPFLRALLKF